MIKLLKIQEELKAPKNQYNSFGDYKYRSCEDILTAVKPLLTKYTCLLTLRDKIINAGNRFYIEAVATIIDLENGEKVEVTALAREAETKKKMDDSQITGTASSYARKYALNGLFLIDDTKDADTNNYYKQTNGEPTQTKSEEVIMAEITKKFRQLVNKYGSKDKVYSLMGMTREEFTTKLKDDKCLTDLLSVIEDIINA